MPHGKEFLKPYAPEVTINKMPIKEFKEVLKHHLKILTIKEKWLSYNSLFPHMSNYFRSSPEYFFQSSLINGEKTGSHLNLYKLFTERCFNLIRDGGFCGIVMPSGIYSDEGAKGLRDLLFNYSRIQGLFSFENRKTIFEGVDSRFKFVVLTFEKSFSPKIQSSEGYIKNAVIDAYSEFDSHGTIRFPAAFMKHDVADISNFPDEDSLLIDTKLIRRLSPDSHSVMEFKTQLDIQIAEKMFLFPLLGAADQGEKLILRQGLNMTSDSHLFSDKPDAKKLPLIEGKMAHQFQIGISPYRYWIDVDEGRKALLGRQMDIGQTLEYQAYRLAFRRVASNTNERTLIATILPPGVFGAESFNIAQSDYLTPSFQVYLTAILNSFVVDFLIRQMVTTNLSMFFIYQLPVPRLAIDEARYLALLNRSARLICDSYEFDGLMKELNLTNFSRINVENKFGVTEILERSKIRAELDGLIAHVYQLSEVEFAHILTTFPLVAEPVKVAALNAYRDVERGLIK